MEYRYNILRLLWPVYFLSGFFPRSTRIWAFGSYNNSFTDNAKYLFLEQLSTVQAKGIRFVWITGNQEIIRTLREAGLEAYKRWSLPGIYFALRARYYFYNSYASDINFWFCRNAVLVNLWHGIPLKKFEFDIRKGALADRFATRPLLKGIRNRFLYHWHYKRPDYVLVSSETVGHLYNSALRVSEKNWLLDGLPRNVQLLRSKEEVMADLTSSGDPDFRSLGSMLAARDKVILYVPTWREKDPDVLTNAGFDFEKLNDLMGKHNALFLIKLHVNSPVSATDPQKYGNIRILKNSFDAYSIMPLADVLVTDYSSIFYDYLLLDRKIVFFPFDYDHYMEENRDFYYPYDSHVPGKIVKTFETMCVELFADDEEETQRRMQDMKKRIWKYQTRNSAASIVGKFSRM